MSLHGEIIHKNITSEQTNGQTWSVFVTAVFPVKLVLITLGHFKFSPIIYSCLKPKVMVKLGLCSGIEKEKGPARSVRFFMVRVRLVLGGETCGDKVNLSAKSSVPVVGD